MPNNIEIIDRGRGPQLSTSRITVQDVVPMLKRNCPPEEIMELIPVLTREELRVIQDYVRDHYDDVMEQDRRIAEREANRVTPPEILEILERGRAKRLALMEQFAKAKSQEKNGANSPG
jgi:uncharacterized protein (DUF433 family)